ncbi:MAG: TIGR02444 family protein [Caulobacteraceae bacterium]
MTFWTWALEAYARPGTAEACLDLQDHHGQCVPYLLWAAWAARTGRALDPATLEAGAGVASRWEAAAVGPLRAARRAMKPTVPGVAEAAREGLRAEVKSLELQAEQLLIETLEAMAPAPGPAALPLESGLAAAAAAWPAQASQAALDRLAQTLS